MVLINGRSLRSRFRFPRTRGDGPDARPLVLARMPVPPHPRGWSRPEQDARPSQRGSPAPAGMVPWRRARAASASRFPRTRGDGPPPPSLPRRRRPVPPHPRGWSLREGGAAALTIGSPAPAGMVPAKRSRYRSPAGFPRTRGDGPSPPDPEVAAVVVPPHPRGWSLTGSAIERANIGSPAPAGMVPWRAASCAGNGRFPRTRGDGPPGGVLYVERKVVPPHPRGWSRRDVARQPLHGGSPAPAGMVPHSTTRAPRPNRFPRTRGDGPSGR